jgi:ERCC4-type nuclease
VQLLIDPRAGSEKLLEKFPGECQSFTLEFGDVAFWGNGPDDVPWFIGIEYKQIEDVVGCIKSGRFTGTQLPGMMRLYDASFLLVEGISKPDPHSGQLVRYRGRATYGTGINYRAYDNWLTAVQLFSSLSGKPCIVKKTDTFYDTQQVIKNLYEYFQKPWEKHSSISRPDQSKIQNVTTELEVIKVDPSDPEYPKYWLRKAVFQLSRCGWDVAGKIADTYVTMENLLSAGQKELEGVERVGKGLAQRLYAALHGHPDPEVKQRRRKVKTNEPENVIELSIADVVADT